MPYPLFLHVRNLPCLVVGGGAVGLRKTLGLLDAGADVTLVDPHPPEPVRALAREGRLKLEVRPFREEDLEGMRLVFAATSSREVNAGVAEGARRLGIFCNVADAPQASDFFLPALVKRGDLLLAISTGGRSPAFARKLRMDLEALFDGTYMPFLELMGAVREHLLQKGHDPEGHREIFRALVEGPLLDSLRTGDRETAIRSLSPFVGEEGAEVLLLSVMQEAPEEREGSDHSRKKGKPC